MADSVAEDHPEWNHVLHSQDVLIDFITFVEERNVSYRDTEVNKQTSEWPFGKYPQINAVQDMYKPEPKQMPMICFNCGHTGIAYCFAT